MAPTNAAVASFAGAQLRVSWRDRSNNESRFRVERSANQGPFISIRTVAANTTSFTDATVTEGNYYAYRVRAENGGGSSSYAYTGASDPVLNLPCDPGDNPVASVSQLEFRAPSSGKAKFKNDEYVYVVGDTLLATATVGRCTAFKHLGAGAASRPACDPIEPCGVPMQARVVSTRTNANGTRDINLEITAPRTFNDGTAYQDIDLVFTSGASDATRSFHWIGVADIDVGSHVTTISEDELLNQFITSFYQTFRDRNRYELGEDEDEAEIAIDKFRWSELRVDPLPGDGGIALALKVGTSIAAWEGTAFADCAPNVSIRGVLELNARRDATSLYVGASWKEEPEVDFHYFDEPITCPVIIPGFAKAIIGWGLLILEKSSEDDAAESITDNLRLELPGVPDICLTTDACINLIEIRTTDRSLQVILPQSINATPDNVVVTVGYNRVSAVPRFEEGSGRVDLRSPLLLPPNTAIGLSASGLQRSCRNGDLHDGCDGGTGDAPGFGMMSVGTNGLFNYAWDTESTTGWIGLNPAQDPYFSPVPSPWTRAPNGLPVYLSFRRGGWEMQRGLGRSICEPGEDWRFCAPTPLEIGRFMARFHDGYTGQGWFFDSLYGACEMRPVDDNPVYLELARNDSRFNDVYNPYPQSEGTTRVVVSFKPFFNRETPRCLKIY